MKKINYGLPQVQTIEKSLVDEEFVVERLKDSLRVLTPSLVLLKKAVKILQGLKISPFTYQVEYERIEIFDSRV